MNLPEKEKALGMYEQMVLIRKYEEQISYLFLEGIMPGSIHQSHGQEASAVGTLYDLRKDDYMLATHRPAGADIAKGVTVESMMGEMFAKTTGCNGGYGGAMHTGDVSVGALPANAIVAGNMPIAVGVGISCQLKGEGNVVVSYFGDGACNEGAFHEALNAAAVWKTPVIFVCENNLYGASTPIHDTCLLANPAADRGPAYGIPARVVDGNDVFAVNEAMQEAVERARSGQGPTILELKTYRIGGHSRSDSRAYRTREEEAAWAEKDPLKVTRKILMEHYKVSAAELDELESRQEARVEKAAELAQAAPDPKPEDAFRHVYWEGGVQ